MGRLNVASRGYDPKDRLDRWSFLRAAGRALSWGAAARKEVAERLVISQHQKSRASHSRT